MASEDWRVRIMTGGVNSIPVTSHCLSIYIYC